MSKPVLDEPAHDWKDAFKCPKCKGRLRIRDNEIVCEKCGYREAFVEKLPRIFTDNLKTA